MAEYAISFRIQDKTVSGRTYDDRYNALIEALRLGTSRSWEETTAFVVISNSRTIDQVAAACKLAIAPSEDIVLILSVNTKAGRVIGNVQDQDLFVLIPFVQKV